MSLDARVSLQVERTVEPSSIHRRHAETVFLTDVQPDGEDGFLAAAQLPAGHRYYGAHTAEANRRLDPMLLLESARQAHNYLAHTYFEVEASAPFILNSCSLKLDRDAYLRLPTGAGLVRMTSVQIEAQRVGRRTRSTFPVFTLQIDGTTIGEAGLSVNYASAAAYRSLRIRARGSELITSDDLAPTDWTGAVTPAAVGRTEATDVLLADLDGDRARLIIPGEHTGLFDHPLDHVPGTLFVEAARQFAAALAPDPGLAVMTGMTATFHTFAELDRPVTLTATRHGGDLIVAAVQEGTPVATVTLSVR